jgi:hypothetical protein
MREEINIFAEFPLSSSRIFSAGIGTMPFGLVVEVSQGLSLHLSG